MTLFATESDLLGNEGNAAFAGTALSTKNLSAEFTLCLFLQLLPAFRAHLWRLLTSFSHKLP